MELALALIIFAAMIAVWFMLPGSASVEATRPWAASESLPMVAPAKA